MLTQPSPSVRAGPSRYRRDRHSASDRRDDRSLKRGHRIQPAWFLAKPTVTKIARNFLNYGAENTCNLSHSPCQFTKIRVHLVTPSARTETVNRYVPSSLRKSSNKDGSCVFYAPILLSGALMCRILRYFVDDGGMSTTEVSPTQINGVSGAALSCHCSSANSFSTLVR